MTSTETKTPAKTTARKAAPAKKAPAKAAAKPAQKPAADKPASTKLRWVFPEGFAERPKTGQTAVAGDREYAMLPDGEAWKATVKQDGKTTTLAEGKFGKCYNAITAHNKAASGTGAAA